MTYVDPVELTTILDKEFTFFHTCRWIADAYVVEFYVQDFWHKLPSCWQRSLENVEPWQLAELLCDGNQKWSRVWPLSLLAYRVAAAVLSLPRMPDENTFLSDDSEMSNFDSLEDFQKDKHQRTLCAKAVAGLRYHRVKSKKLHEIHRLAYVVHSLASKVDCSKVIDVGCGQGHLSRFLSFGLGLNVISIDADDNHMRGAQRLDSRAKRSCRYNEKESMNKPKEPKYITHRICSDTSPDHFRELTLMEDECVTLVGLHTCGDLGPTMIRLFAEIPNIRVLVSIGCCYMKGQEKRSASGVSESLGFSYPMSNFLKNKPGHQMSYDCLELACHAKEQYIRKLTGNSSKLKLHCYRAALEWLLKNCGNLSQDARISTRTIKRIEDASFTKYAAVALQRLGFEGCISEEELQAGEKFCEQEWRKVMTFHVLRLMLAPVIESIVLVDRMLWLRERGFSCKIRPLFDPLVSPRNLVLIARKSQDGQ